MSGVTPWFKFYPRDWQADQQLRVCSLAARGLWIECMSIMHHAQPYGHLVVNGRRPTDAQLAILTGTPLEQLAGLMAELSEAAVFSTTRTGVIYSRRMTRDERKRKDGATAAESGTITTSRRGQQTLDLEEEKLPPPGVVSGVAEKPPRSQSTEYRVQKESISADIDAAWDRFRSVYPKRRGDQEWKRARERFERFVREGVDPEEIIGGAKRYGEEQIRLGNTGDRAQYVKQAASFLGARTWEEYPPAKPKPASTNGTHGPRYDPRKEHDAALMLKIGREQMRWWRSSFGPMPHEDGCLIPAHLLRAEDGQGWVDVDEARQ